MRLPQSGASRVQIEPSNRGSSSLEVLHEHAEASIWSASLYVPIELEDDSGVAHVLEHMIGTVDTSHGHKFSSLPDVLPGTRICAVTQFDSMCFSVESQSESAFLIALQTLYLAAFTSPLPESLFRQEAFNVVRGVGGNARFGGTVYNEMRVDYFDPVRQLDRATRLAAALDDEFPFDPGGDPAHLRHLTHDAVMTFASRYLRVERATLFARTPGEGAVIYEALRLLSAAPLRTVESKGLPRTRRPSALNYLAGSPGSPTYRRYALCFGEPLQPDNLVHAWIVECAFSVMEVPLTAFGAKFGATFEPLLSGLVDLGRELIVGVTYGVLKDAGTLQLRDKLPLVARHLIANLPHEAWIRHADSRLAAMLSVTDRGHDSFAALMRWARSTSSQRPSDFADRLTGKVSELVTPAGFVHALSTIAQNLRIVEAVLEPSSRTTDDAAAHEERLLRRIGTRARVSSTSALRSPSEQQYGPKLHRDVVVADEAEHVIHTQGYLYRHEVYNLSAFESAELMAVQSIGLRIRELAHVRGEDVETYLFCHPELSGASVVLFAVRTKIRSHRASQLVDVIDQLWETIERSDSVGDGAFAARAWDALTRSTETFAFAESIDRLAESSDVLRGWQGVPQLEYLARAAEAGHASGPWVARAARMIRGSPCVEFLVEDQVLPDELIRLTQAKIEAIHWPVRTPASAPRHRARSMLVSGWSNECVVSRRAAIPLDEIEQAAAALAMRVAMNQHYMIPKFRNQLGAYGAFFDCDVSTMELCYLVYRTGSPAETLQALRQERPSDSLGQVTEAEFAQAQQDAIARLEGRGSALNVTTARCYSLLNGINAREVALTSAIRSLTLRRSREIVDQLSCLDGTDVVCGARALSRTLARDVQDHIDLARPVPTRGEAGVPSLVDLPASGQVRLGS